MSQTVMQVFAHTVAEYGDKVALKHKQDGRWVDTSFAQYYADVQQAARGFMHLGLEPGRAVSIIGYNCPQWLVSDLAAIAAGGMPAGIYTTSSPELCAYVAGHCKAQIVVVENAEHLEKFKKIRDQLPELKAIVMMFGEDADDDVYSWADLLKLGDNITEAELDKRLSTQNPQDCATLIYTSGTTGQPKAVMMSHHNMVWTAQSVAGKAGAKPGNDQISYLPLSHIAEQMFSILAPISIGITVWFAESIDLLLDTLQEARPQAFFGVPRVWEKMQHKMQAAGAEASPLQKKIAAWARGVGLKASEAEEQGSTSKPLLYPLAKKLVFDRVAGRLGMDRSYFRGTGAAPIARETLDFFASLDLPLYEVWGQSESTGGGTLNYPGNVRRGSIGRAYPETEIKIADDGEILMRGPSVFMGYLDNEKATKETIDSDGWLLTGDVGQIDDDGFVYITDRKKELIITAGGENISPAHVEGEIKSIPSISQCCVIGDKRKYLTALVTLDEESLADAARAAGSPAKTPEEAANCDKFNAWLGQQVETMNFRLARVQTIKKWTVLKEDFSIDGGELTPTMKLKRRVVHDKYEDQIDAMYAD